MSTMHYIEKTLPSTDCLEIIIDSLPTKEKSLIWRRLVNLKSVVQALEWLKKNNELYKNININTFGVECVFDKLEVEQQDNILNKLTDPLEKFDDIIQNNLEIIDASHITELMKDSLVINQNLSNISLDPLISYSVYELDQCSNRSDLEKYQMQHINNKPFDDCNLDIDHLCFPNIFPTGKGTIKIM
jgi:hypothetical protein